MDPVPAPAVPPNTEYNSALPTGLFKTLLGTSAALATNFKAPPINFNLPGNLSATLEAACKNFPGPFCQSVPFFAAPNIFFLITTYGAIDPDKSPASSAVGLPLNIESSAANAAPIGS